jgi:hypothetical protein
MSKPLQLIGSGPDSVIAVYKDMMNVATEEGSIYIQTKDTIKELLIDNSALSDRAKVDMITSVISKLAIGTTNHALDVAVKMCIEDRDAPIALTKIRVNTELLKARATMTDKDKLVTEESGKLIDQQIKTSIIDGWSKQANLYRDAGYDVSSWSISDTRIALSPTTEECVKAAGTAKVFADTYAGYADSIMQNGDIGYTVGDKGNLLHAVLSDKGMMHAQARVADRNRIAFDDNMRQHVVNSSASMLAVMIGSEAFESSASYDPYIDQWCHAVGYLNKATSAC